MNNQIERSDAILYYHEGSAVEIASRESTAAWGNLADAMRNAIVVISKTRFQDPIQILPSPEDVTMKDARPYVDGSEEPLSSDDHPVPVNVAPGPDYTIQIEFSDGNSGNVDLSDWAEKGIFRRWENREFFESVHIDGRKAVAWGDQDDMDVCADTIYMMLTGISVEDLFPRLQGFMDEYA